MLLSFHILCQNEMIARFVSQSEKMAAKTGKEKALPLFLFFDYFYPL